jgi:chemotaxis response regulator CheB
MSEGQAQSKTTSIVLVDDHQLLTDALTAILHGEPDLQVVGVADTCAAARVKLSQTCPGVLLLDVALPDGDGLGLVPEINRLCPDTYILVLTSFSVRGHHRHPARRRRRDRHAGQPAHGIVGESAARPHRACGPCQP